MFRIRKISDITTLPNQRTLDQAKDILRSRFPLLGEDKILQFADQLRDPLKYKLHSELLVAEGTRSDVKGLALMMHAPDLNFVYLDFIATLSGRSSSGIGEALYERVREDAVTMKATGIFMECLPDDPALCREKEILEENRKRLAFYERFGARPLINTSYETPVNPGDDCPPYLVVDPLERDALPGASEMKKIIKAILERKYGTYCPPEYIRKVTDSVQDPVNLRPLQYFRTPSSGTLLTKVTERQKIRLIVNDKHDIHHVREIGYVESPVRIKAILKEILKTDFFSEMTPSGYPDKWIEKIHDKGYIGYFKKICENMPPDKSVYPYVFPIRNNLKPPKDLSVRAGYYCIDTFTPLNKNAYIAARRAVDCALTAADAVLQGSRTAYALVRPPGHHAEHATFGGFCYFNSNAVAANYLSQYGKVAILDVDYHHGNGQQQIFYRRNDVMTVSIHGHPSFAYPYFSGFREETGEGPGEGFNINFPLKETIETVEYFETLKKAIKKIVLFKPVYLIVAMGFDTAKGDPTGTWKLGAKDFEQMGKLIASPGIPAVIVQEGGYRSRSIGINARYFFSGLWSGFFKEKQQTPV